VVRHLGRFDLGRFDLGQFDLGQFRARRLHRRVFCHGGNRRIQRL
jgi:hypothetical protein